MNPRNRLPRGATSFLFSPWLGVVCLGLLVALSALPARAQLTSAGTISGQVLDPQGALVAAATVVVTDTATSSRRTATTNEVGRYIFLNVPPGTYNVSVTKGGFKEARFTGQRLQVGEVLNLNVPLEVGETSTSVEVIADAAAALQTTTAAVGTTITAVSLMALPNIGRDANAFATLQPGVTPSGEVAGRANDQSMFMVDGGNVSSDQDGNYRNYTISSGSMSTGSGGTPSGVVPTPVESVEEFRVSTNNQTADFGSAAGGQVQMITKRGANQFHGSAYEYYFGSEFSANSWSNNRRGTPKVKTHENRFGATLGGPLTPEFWGAKTFFFFNYEGRRFPQVQTYERSVPTTLMRAGVIQVPDSTGTWRPYNLNPQPVTVDGVTYQPALCGADTCDPRGVGLNPVISEIWNKYMPLPNNPDGGDKYNTQGYRSQLALPISSNFAVARVDRDLHPNHRLLLSYRYYHLKQFATGQVDIGGFFPGNTLGEPKSMYTRPQIPSFMVAGLTSVLSPRLINDFRFNYTRNYWRWDFAGMPPQLPGLAAPLDFGLIPYQSSVTVRYWNGQDKYFRDDLSYMVGNHLFQFGGTYGRMFLQHLKFDNGLGMQTTPKYLVGSGTGIATPTAYIPSTVRSSEYSNWNSLYAQVLGFVNEAHVFYPRKGGVLEPFGTGIMARSLVRNYNLYFSDVWKVTPRWTLTYGMGYEIQMPPYDLNGNQPMVVDSDGNSFVAADYMALRKKAALAGTAYQPILGFATVRNVGEGRKYPFDPVYSGFSPRVSAAWNPSFGGGRTVLRGGYARIYGRINGINVVQVPLQGTGVGQTVACTGPSRDGQCLGPQGVDASSVFRIGVDGMSAPLPGVDQVLEQPFYPGVGGNPPLGESWIMDARISPPRSDQFTFSIQHQLSSNVKVEVGYIGVISRNEMWRNELNAVPYMTTLNGQSFAQAYANLHQMVRSGQAIQPQAFFEAAMGGAGSAYCKGHASCTAAVASKQRSNLLNTNVRNLWSGLDSAPGWTLGRTLTSSAPAQSVRHPVNVSGAFSNYNAAFTSLTLRNWHGLTATSNLTFSRTLGNGGTTQNGITSMDVWDRQVDYRPLGQDIPWLYNLIVVYEPPVFRGQTGVLGRVLGGWSLAPLFTARSGTVRGVGTGSQSVGGWTGGWAVGTSEYTGGNSSHYNIVATGTAGSNGNASRGGSGINLFADPQAVYDSFRPMILGVDGRFGPPLRGFPDWNIDLGVKKNILVRESIGATLIFEFMNVLNRFQPGNPNLNIFSAANFGVVSGQGNSPRRIEFGLRIFF